MDDSSNDRKPRVSFKLTTPSKAKNFPSDLIESLIKADNYSPEECTPEINLLSEFMNSTQKHIITGKRTLLISESKGYKRKSNMLNRCYDHSLKYYNL